jgi:hypothetical protein
MLPYIITEDLEILMRRWSEKTGIAIPDADFFREMRVELCLTLKEFFVDAKISYIQYATLAQQMAERIERASETSIVVSIDRVYDSAPFHLESNRVADLETMKILGETERPGFPSITEQIAKLPNSKPITLADDGCFSGATLKQIVRKFHSYGKTVGKVIVGISINPSENVFVEAFPQIPLCAVHTVDQVKDWVCERDFYLGVPFSGRTAGKKEGDIVKCIIPEIALAYCYPFGDPIDGASVPTQFGRAFSEQVIRQSTRLWNEIGRIRNSPILCSEVPRLPKGIVSGNQPFVDAVNSQFYKYCQTKA